MLPSTFTGHSSFNAKSMIQKHQINCALTIAGSDSGGGAGIQADLKTFQALGVHGVCAVTAITAQNPREVMRITPVHPRDVIAQLKAVIPVMKPLAAKTGMLFSVEIIQAVVKVLKSYPRLSVVVDPVMISTSGRSLLRPGAVQTLRRELFPRAILITPNLAEAARLAGSNVNHVEQMKAAARKLFDAYGCAVLIKGGHLKPSGNAVDVFWNGEREECFVAPFVCGLKTHGTGCAFSAAITAFLAQGQDLNSAIQKAKAYINRILHNTRKVGRFDILGPKSSEFTL
jgi:hydroxymethylpyrimidine/phosphomethylpyrimidine kinase